MPAILPPVLGTFDIAAVNAVVLPSTFTPRDVNVASSGFISFSSRGLWRSPSDAEFSFRNFAETIQANLAVEANDVLSQRRGTNAQINRVYNTYTDASNYERYRIGYSSNVFKITGEVAGTGISRPLVIQSDGITTLGMEDSSNNPGGASIAVYRNDTSGNTQFAVGGRGGTGLTSTTLLHTRLMPIINQASGTYTILDINPTETAIGAGPHYLIQGRIGAGSNVFSVRNDGKVLLGSTAQFGGTSSSFPMWKQNGSQFLARKADDSAYTQITALGYQIASSTVGSLPAASSWGYTIMAVADLNSTTRGATATGGGSLKGLVWSDGTNWLVV